MAIINQRSSFLWKRSFDYYNLGHDWDLLIDHLEEITALIKIRKQALDEHVLTIEEAKKELKIGQYGRDWNGKNK